MKFLQAGKRMVILSMVVLSATACQFIAGNKAKTANSPDATNPADAQKTYLQDSSCSENQHPNNHSGMAGAHESIIWDYLSANMLSIIL